ncbi:hypothetical protein FRC09_014297 [Ceratobasidium sp. 395]|nr:hypothetical protein FRC09_014297 [Ceratobasidium sp. 395]
MTTCKSSPLFLDLTGKLQSPHSVTCPLLNPTFSLPVPSQALAPVFKPPIVQQRLYFDAVENLNFHKQILPPFQMWVAHQKRQYKKPKVDTVVEEKRALRPKALRTQEQNAQDKHTTRIQEEGRQDACQDVDEMLVDKKQKALEKLKNKINIKQ